MLELVLSKYLAQPWAMHPGMLEVLSNVLTNKSLGVKIKEEVDSNNKDLIKYDITDSGKAIIPMEGVVLKRTMAMEGVSGLVSTLNIEKSLIHAAENSSVKDILLVINTPGGTVEGTMEVADLINELKQIKNIDGYINGMGCSAGYWIGSACNSLSAYYTAEVGSIGVYQMHVDYSRFYENEGIKVSYIKAGKYKTAGNPFEPIKGEQKDELQKRVDGIYKLFVNAVAKNRNVSVEYVLEHMAEGRTFLGEEAKELKLIDEVINLEGVIEPSNTYSFLKGEKSMAFGKKEISVESIKTDHEEIYSEIFEAGKAEAEEEASKKIADLTAQNNALKNQISISKENEERMNKICSFADSLGLAEYGKELSQKNDLSLEAAYEKLVEKSAQNKREAQSSFNDSAPDAAGHSEDGREMDGKEPTTKEEAKRYCKEKYGCSNSEAWKYARREYKQFFV